MIKKINIEEIKKREEFLYGKLSTRSLNDLTSAIPSSLKHSSLLQSYISQISPVQNPVVHSTFSVIGYIPSRSDGNGSEL